MVVHNFAENQTQIWSGLRMTCYKLFMKEFGDRKDQVVVILFYVAMGNCHVMRQKLYRSTHAVVTCG